MKNLGLGLLIFGIVLLVISAGSTVAIIFNFELNGRATLWLASFSSLSVIAGSVLYVENR